MQLNKSSRRSKVIGLTPLIDVVFILLLFFMLSTQFSPHHALVLSVPAPDSAPSDSTQSDNLFIRLLVDGSLLINGTVINDLAQLRRNEHIVAALVSQAFVWIDADELASLQGLVSLTDELSAIGLNNIKLRALK